MSIEENKNLVRRFIEALDTNNLSTLDDLLSPELAQVWQGGINTGPFSEHHVTITDMVAEGDKVVVRLATQGIHSGEWQSIPATGKRWTNWDVVVFRLEQGKIVEGDMLFDQLGLLRQFGATILPPTAASS